MDDELKVYQGLKWKEARDKLKGGAILLAMSKDPLCMAIAKALDKNGIDAAMAVLCAVLYVKRNGSVNTVRMAVKLYREALKRAKGDFSETYARIDNIEYWTAWVRGSRFRGRNHGWPLKPPRWRNPDKLGGLAGIMFHVGAIGCAEGGSTAETILASGVAKFLKEGLERKERRQEAGRRQRTRIQTVGGRQQASRQISK